MNKYIFIGIVIILAIIGFSYYGSAPKEVENPVVLQSNNSYTDYAPEKVMASESKIVLYFHADWCPICRDIDSNIKSSLSEIPNDLLILKTDFDKETALRQKYGVTYQHTFVQIDQAGNLINKWSGNMKTDVADVTTNLK